MPNGIRYSASVVSGALNKNNIALAISGSYGPTETTGFFNGVDPTGSNGLGYVIYKTTTSNSSSIFVPQTNNELLSLARQEGATGANTGSNAAILSYFASASLYCPTNFTYPAIYATGLTRNFDPAFVNSYPTTGSTWYSIGQGGTALLANSPTYRTGSGYGTGSLEFNGTNQLVGSIGGGAFPSSGAFTLSIWIYTNFNITSSVNASLISGATGQNSIGYNYSFGSAAISVQTTIGNITLGNAGTDGNSGWKNYTITRNASNLIKVYKNNSDITIGTNNLGGNWTMQGMVKSSASGYYRGLIGSVQYYQNILLTTDQLTANYNALKGIYGL